LTRSCPCLASHRADSKCRGLIVKSIEDNSPRLDSTVAMTRHRSSPSSAAAPILPPIVISLMAPFRSFFTAPVWEHVLVLVSGVALAPGKRTVSAALRVMGLGAAHDFALYHYVLSRARWNSRAIARTLLTMILDRFLPTGPVVIGIDDTIERRWGRKIAARSVYRDPVRSSHGHFVKTSGLRWLSLMAMVPHSMDAATLGLALPDHSGALRTLQHGMQAPSQKADGLGSPSYSPGSAMGARSQDRRRRRLQFRGARSDRRGSPPCLSRHAAAARREPLRASA
jgi:DDE superfamily endonuclease